MAENNNFRAGLIQMRTGCDIAVNLRDVEQLIREAAAGGAQYIQTPENTLIMEFSRSRLTSPEICQQLNAGYQTLANLADELNIWLHIGASPVCRGDTMMSNRSMLINPDGRITCQYDKIHMFDADLENGESYRESKTYQPGDIAQLASLPWGTLGMTICYDVRFPALFRSLAQCGADFIATPAAFALQTGEVHWHILLRARAIETGCFIMAAAQGGLHETGRSTYGHSLVVSPWGEVIAEAKNIETCVIYADINTDQVEMVRKRVPSLSHDRPFRVETAKDEPER